MFHNIAYYALSFAQLFGANVEETIGHAKDVDVGATIFADKHDKNPAKIASDVMKISYAITGLPWLIDFGINGWRFS